MTAAGPALAIRIATPADVPALERLIERSARALSRGYYTGAQIEAAIAHVFGVDSLLVADGTYLVAEWNGALAGCGGWSRFATLFGGDRFAERQDGVPLDPAVDAARIRAFFVGEEQARRGVGRALLVACEAAARQAGFRRTTLMATLPGEPFYATHGYRAEATLLQNCGGVAVPFVTMSKAIVA
ncbi:MULTISPECIES: GNAT family N-acetyltransferase [unclassified Sphingomonas]|jgi:predicted N-acetyltransferase YhbS|uniref:GNAT family N-acetyltransferase n=1 Tax=unclassified Sphingomonas TaxID=196159 RepID=UPI0025DD2AB7|nr:MULTISPECIES: GNAT family N-acetyltransferase [unclassified Sphingomonas]